MSFSFIRLKAEVRLQAGIPDVDYPVPSDRMFEVLKSGHDIPLGMLLHGLQLYSAATPTCWQQVEPTMQRLAQILAATTTETDASHFVRRNWAMELGGVDTSRAIVAIHRDEELIVAIGPSEDDTLKVDVFRPMDAKSLAYLTSLARPASGHHAGLEGVTRWELARDATASVGNFYAADAGAAYLASWDRGLGISWDGTKLPQWIEQQELKPRRGAEVVAELNSYVQWSDVITSEGGTEAGY